MSPAFFTPEMECYSVLILHFFERSSRDQWESPEGRGEGSDGFSPSTFRPLLVNHPRVAVSFLGASAKNIPLNPRGKGEVFTLGLSDARLLLLAKSKVISELGRILERKRSLLY